MKKISLIPVLLFVLFTIEFYGQTNEEIQSIKNNSNILALDILKTQYNSNFQQRKQSAIQYATLNGLEVFIENENGSFDELMDITSDGKPIYYSILNTDAAISSRTNHLNSGGSLGLNLNGQNITAYVWDGGPVRTSHQEFQSRVSIGDGATTLNANSFHSTHVTGTISSAGIVSSSKGMANQSNVISNDWNNDLSEAANSASNGMLLSNHSYGLRTSNLPDWMFGAYSNTSRDWDNLMYNAPYYLMIKSAGNDGNNNSYNALPLNGNSNYDKLGPRSTSKNNLVVAASNDANISSNGDLISVSIASFSSQGPTDDLRIKPDITGNGVGLYSTYDNSNTAYNSISGTSMSSPSVTGTLLLLQEHYNNINSNFMKAATLKGLVLHTADDSGITGPDSIWGWGLLNAKKAAEAISNNSTTSIILENTLSNQETYSYTVSSDGLNPLLASISWTDLPGTANSGSANSSSPALINDLDIRITKNGINYMPYKLTSITTNEKGDNIVDPYERVDITNASGEYTITVTHKGNLINGDQNFSLIITGINEICSLNPPTILTTSNIIYNSADLSWTNVTGNNGYQIEYKQVNATSWNNIDINIPNTILYQLNGLQDLTTYQWRIRTKCSNGQYGIWSSNSSFTTPLECLENITKFNSINSGTEYIETSNNITSYSTITGKANVTYSAGNSIVLKVTGPPFNLSFHAKPGHAAGRFLAKIEGCDNITQKVIHENKNYNSVVKQFNNDSINYDFINNQEVAKLENIESIKLYPNPTNNILNISSKENISHWELTNQLGRVLKKGDVNGSKTTKFNLQNLPTGIYFVKVTLSNGEQIIKRAIKN